LRLSTLTLALGLALAAVFFLLAPRSPIVGALGGPTPGLEVVEDAAGAAGLALVVLGYALREFEAAPRWLAEYRVGAFLTLLVWSATGSALWRLLLPGSGLLGLFAGLTLALPVVVAGYLVLRRRLGIRGRVVVVPSV
jgi:hypothetical protein